jgi:hypothetical protein
MPESGPASTPARSEWVAAAELGLGPVLVAAEHLRLAFDPDTGAATVVALDPASHLVAACDGLLEWLAGAPAPDGRNDAEAELRATAGVLRNAAFAFRSLADADPSQLSARTEACAAMLEQGAHHVDAFRRLTR